MEASPVPESSSPQSTDPFSAMSSRLAEARSVADRSRRRTNILMGVVIAESALTLVLAFGQVDNLRSVTKFDHQQTVNQLSAEKNPDKVVEPYIQQIEKDLDRRVAMDVNGAVRNVELYFSKRLPPKG